MKRYITFMACFLVTFCFVHAVEVGPPIEVASQVKGSRNQTWPSVGWSEGAKCWLVVWREGYLNEEVSDIWCARVAENGKALDSIGLKLTSGNSFCDRPRVASDGKKFLVVWEEMSKNKDWDVYGAIVSADSNLQAEKSFLIAGGEHNQCRPDVAFVGSNYHVVWMGYENNVYNIYWTRTSASSEGKLAGEKPVIVASVKARKPDNPVNAILPVIASNAEGELLTAFHVRDAFRSVYVGRRAIDAKNRQLVGSEIIGAGDKTPIGGRGWGGRERTLALAMGSGEAITVSIAETMRSKNDIIIGRLSVRGDLLSVQEASAGSLGIIDQFRPLSSRSAVAYTGKSYIAVSEVLNYVDAKKRHSGEYYARVVGWKITPEGNVEGEAFPVAGEPGKECVLPSIASGSASTCLVVYSEIRGVDDVKIVTRMIK